MDGSNGTRTHRAAWRLLDKNRSVRDLRRREVWPRTLAQADSAPRVWCHDKQWRLRFVVAPTEQLRINFEVAPKSDASWDSRRLYRRNRFQSPFRVSPTNRRFASFEFPVDEIRNPSNVAALFHPIYGKHPISSKTRSADPGPHAPEPTRPHRDKISTEEAEGRCRCWRRETGSA